MNQSLTICSFHTLLNANLVFHTFRKGDSIHSIKQLLVIKMAFPIFLLFLTSSAYIGNGTNAVAADFKMETAQEDQKQSGSHKSELKSGKIAEIDKETLKNLILEVAYENGFNENLKKTENLERKTEQQEATMHTLQDLLKQKEVTIQFLRSELEKNKIDRINYKQMKQQQKNVKAKRVSNDQHARSRSNDGLHTASKQESTIVPTAKLQQRATIFPRQAVAFSVSLSQEISSQNLHNGIVIKFPNILTNEQSSYNKYTGIFTAPQDGMYFFSFHTDASYDGLFFVNLKNNGQTAVNSIANPDNHSTSISNSAVLRLSVGDAVWLEISNLELSPLLGLKSQPACSFSGFLL